MKRLMPALMFSLVACGGSGGGLSAQQTEIPLLQLVESGQGSQLTVPKSCPIWSPGGGDVDTPENPLPDHVSLLCAVDSLGGSYGIVTGDAPTAELAVIPGNREVGLLIAVDSSARFTPDSASIQAWAAPTNVNSSHDCCAESHPNSGLAVRMVAAGNQGMLLSLGSFDGMPTQVAFSLTSFGSWTGRFYVSGAP